MIFYRLDASSDTQPIALSKHWTYLKVLMPTKNIIYWHHFSSYYSTVPLLLAVWCHYPSTTPHYVWEMKYLWVLYNNVEDSTILWMQKCKWTNLSKYENKPILTSDRPISSLEFLNEKVMWIQQRSKQLYHYIDVYFILFSVQNGLNNSNNECHITMKIRQTAVIRQHLLAICMQW